MTKTENQLQDIIESERANRLSRSWNRTEAEIDAACASFLGRRLATVAVADYDEEQ